MTSPGRVGRYEIRRVIGRGGMATVYQAYESDLDRDVALKELTLGAGSGREAARRFLREARLAGSFSHPNIVTVHEYFEHGGTPYIAMEYLVRGTLRAFVGRLSLQQVGGVLEGLLAALAYAGERCVVHRDLKPENLMVTSQGRVKVADFGIARATSATRTANLTTTGTTLGTPRYMAPERALGQELGPWSDLYSVGVIAYELLVGRTPFHEEEEPIAVLLRHINDPVPPVISLVPDVGQDLSDWVDRLLVKAPERRTRSAAAAWEELDEILIGGLGPRWLRAAGLPAQPGGTAASRAGSTIRPRRSPASPPGAIPAPDTSRSGAHGSSPGAPRPPGAMPSSGSQRSAAHAAPPGAGLPPGAGPSRDSSRSGAFTVAPSTLPLPRRRRRRRHLVALAVLVLAAIAAVGLATNHEPDGPPGSSAVVPQVDSARADLASASNASERERAATALAEQYDRTARSLEAGRLRTSVERTADAYRRAAVAVRREDGSDYDDAIADARAGERAIERAQRGAGDSQSDDPSDDEPDENEP